MTTAIITNTGAQQLQEVSADMFEQYIAYIDRSSSTVRAYIINLRQFAAWLKYMQIAKPERRDIIAYKEYLKAEHDAIQLDTAAPEGWSYRTDKAGNHIRILCKPNTVMQYLRSVKQFFTWTAAEGYYPNIAQNIHIDAPKRSHKKDCFQPAEVMAIEEAINSSAAAKASAAADAAKDKEGRVQRSTEQGKRLKAMYLLAVNAGLRTIELHRANIKDIEVKNGQAYIYIYGKGCTGAEQKKPIAQEVMAAINEYLQSRRDDPNGNSPLFASTGNRSGGKRIATTTISTMLKGAMKEAGYNGERLTAHSLRHTAGQALMDITSNNIYLTQMYMRHASPNTTEIYLENNNAKTDADLSNQLYDYYHGVQPDSAQQLQAYMARMTPAQLEQLTQIAAAMVR